MQKAESYCYADDFKARERNQNDMNKVTETIPKWLKTNKMKPNTKKTHTINIKVSITATIGEKDLESVKSQSDLGLIVQQNSSWNENCLSSSRKAMSALSQIKLKLSSSCDWKVSQKAYTGYVVPIAVYASQTWLPSRSNLN